MCALQWRIHSVYLPFYSMCFPHTCQLDETRNGAAGASSFAQNHGGLILMPVLTQMKIRRQGPHFTFLNADFHRDSRLQTAPARLLCHGAKKGRLQLQRPSSQMPKNVKISLAVQCSESPVYLLVFSKAARRSNASPEACGLDKHPS